MQENLFAPLEKIASAYSSDTIFILGKGPSADLVPSEVFENAVMIGLNDAERIYLADISVFHADWVIPALSEQGPCAQLYVTSTDFSAPNATV